MSPISVKSGRYVDESCDEAARTYATFNHLVGLVSIADGMGLLGLIGSIVMWRIKAKESAFLDDHGREAVNFQLSLLLYVAVVMFGALVFTILTLGIGGVIFVLGPLFAIAVTALRLVGCIRGAMAANRGEYYRYPMCVRFFKGAEEA